MKTAKDLIIPFSWEERRPIFLDRFFYLPAKIEYSKNTYPFFEKNRPVVIEYCSGNGQWIGERAKQNPHLNFLAVEKRFDRARKIWLKIHRENILNLTVVCGEGLVFTQFYAPQVSEIYVNFPDPWPKLRHAKHRLVSDEFIKELSRIAPVGGKATLVTDDKNYFEEMQLKFAQFNEWKGQNLSNDWGDYGRSFFKDLWLMKGRTIYYLNYERVCY